MPVGVPCRLILNGEGLLEDTLSEPFSDGLGPLGAMDMLWAGGLLDSGGEVLLRTERQAGRPLKSLDKVGREGRALLVGVGSSLASLDWVCGTISIMVPLIEIPRPPWKRIAKSYQF